MIEAVYRRELGHLAAAAKQLNATSSPVEAFHQWMRLFVDYVATKKILAAVLRSTPPGAANLATSASARISDAINLLVGGAAASSGIRAGVIAGDLLRALYGFTCGGTGPDWEPSAHRLIDLLMDGLRTPGGKPERVRQPADSLVTTKNRA